MSDSKGGVGLFSCLKSVNLFFGASTGSVGSTTDVSDGSGVTSTLIGFFGESILITGFYKLIGFDKGLDSNESVLLDLCDTSSLVSLFNPIFQSGLKRLTGAIASYAALERKPAPPYLFSSLFLGDSIFIPAF